MSGSEQDQQRSKISSVINLGKEQNYLTHAQLYDFFPALVGTKHFDDIIEILEDMNIKVFEFQPSEDELALFELENMEEAAIVLASFETADLPYEPKLYTHGFYPPRKKVTINAEKINDVNDDEKNSEKYIPIKK